MQNAIKSMQRPSKDSVAVLRLQFSNFNESTFIFHPRPPRGNKSDTAYSGYRHSLTANVARWIAFLIIFICPITLGTL